MNKLTRNDYTEVGNDSTPQVSIRVCMHDLRASRNDVRAMRAATTLVETGLAISIVDVESEVARCIEEDIHGIHIHHIMVPDSFGSTRFENWACCRQTAHRPQPERSGRNGFPAIRPKSDRSDHSGSRGSSARFD